MFFFFSKKVLLIFKKPINLLFIYLITNFFKQEEEIEIVKYQIVSRIKVSLVKIIIDDRMWKHISLVVKLNVIKLKFIAKYDNITIIIKLKVKFHQQKPKLY